MKALSDSFANRRADYFEECGLADIDAAIEADTTLQLVRQVSDRLQFHHWSLRFAEIFATRGGFDATFGNPPWIKLEWKEGIFLSDTEPRIEIRGERASVVAVYRGDLVRDAELCSDYFEAYSESEGMQEFLGSLQNFSSLSGVQTNLYKCFLAQSWGISSQEGVSAFVHPEGVYDDPKGGALRSEIYSRLRGHFQFRNVLPLFEGTNDHGVLRFSVNVYGRQRAGDVSFLNCANLYHPRTLEQCSMHDGMGAVPGIKDDSGSWDYSPHRRRLVTVDDQVLEVFSSLYEEEDVNPREARLPIIHSGEIIDVVRKLAKIERRLGDFPDRYFTTRMWEETAGVRDGLIVRETFFPKRVEEWVIQGPHFYVGTPLNKTPNEVCETRGAYTGLDLASLDGDYLPRSNYRPQPKSSTTGVPTWQGAPATSYARIGARRRIVASNERTLIACIIPPGPPHIYTCLSIVMAPRDVAFNAFLYQSIPYDFFVKLTGKADFQSELVSRLPQVENAEIEPYALCRTLRLNCLLRSYTPLWTELYDNSFRKDRFTSSDRRLKSFGDLSDDWSMGVPFRSDIARRNALVECDVLAAMTIGLSFDELLMIYRVQFPVVQQYDRAGMYDQHGRSVPTSKTAAGNPAVSLVELAATLKEQAGFDVHAEYHPDGSNTQELRKQKIRLGKKEADVLGVSERCTMADLLAETEVRWSDEDHPEGRPVRLVGLRYTDPGLEPRMERVYPTPWTRCDREADYRQAWAEFERRLGKKMPEGIPL